MTKKLVNDITSRESNYSQWYTDIITKAELIDYTNMKGFFIMRPYAQAIWENIQNIINIQLKKSGHENVSMPLLMPECLLNKEKDHIAGFNPEVAWVTQGGDNILEEKLCIRPTSEALFSQHFSNIIHSWRDLPKLYNQWCSVIRWEKSTRPFLRSREFLWQEGHTVHSSLTEAKEEVFFILNLYENFINKYLAIPTLKGKKTENEKFAGAEETYTIETMMNDGKILQTATSHYFGNNFSKAFDIKFNDKNNKIKYAFQTSWGISTRLIGSMIMVHSDDNGLILPPKIAPIQVIILPLNNSENIIKMAQTVLNTLDKNNIRSQIDINTKQSIGWKYSEYEKKGIPIRIEIGLKEIENNYLSIVTRYSRKKTLASINDIYNIINKELDNIHNNMYNKAFEYLKKNTIYCESISDIKESLNQHIYLIKSMWCGNVNCELTLKNKFYLTSRFIENEYSKEISNKKCIICNEKANYLVNWGISY